MLAAVTAGVSHPVVAGLIGLGAAGLAALVVAMAWNVHARQIRLAEQLARRQFIVTNGQGAAGSAANGAGPVAVAEELEGANGTARASRVIIDGPDTVVAGEQARYRVRPSGNRKVVSWAAGGGSMAQAPDPAHPDELLVIPDKPGDLMVSVWVREGMTDRRETKSITAVPDATATTPPFTLRLFLHAWGLVVVAVLVVGVAGALVALGNLSAPDFIALVAPLAALLGVIAVARSTGDAGRGPGPGPTAARPKP
jgi:hypothetical protein